MKTEEFRVTETIQMYTSGRITRREFVRKLVLLGFSAPAIGSLLAACSAATPSVPQPQATVPPQAPPAQPQATAAPAAGQPKQGGTVVVGVYQEPNSLNWILTGTPVSFAWMQLYPMFEPMLRVNAKLEPEPALLTEVPTVQNGGISADGLTYTLRMRPGVKWDDGQPCTIKDWVFTWKWIMDPKNGAVNTSGWSQITDVEVKDDTTAMVTLKDLYIPFVAEVLAGWLILPEHVQSKMTTEEFGRKPIGNGPFKFVEWVSGDHITLERNPLYWREPKAWLDRLIWKIVPDRNTVVAQAKTGDIDIGIDYTEAQIPEMSNLPDVELKINNPPIYERYHFTLVTAEDITRPHPIFGDLKVRKAVTLAIDRQTIIDTVLYGKTKIAKNELDNTVYENTDIKLDPFDPEQAKKLLDEAGWKPGPDGIRMKDNLRFSFTNGTTAGNQTRETIQALVQANLKDVGIEMKIANEPASTFFGSFAEGGGWVARKLDMVGFTNGLPSIDPNLRPFWHSKEIPTKEYPNGFNNSGLADPELDKLLDAQIKELDTAKRTELLKKAQQIIHETYPMVPLYDRVSINSVHKRVHGVDPINFGSISGVVWNTDEWWVD
jgi:peptide/nickel transport system substrate-binding protein